MNTIPPPPDWKKLLKPGQRLLLGSGAACPHALIESLLLHVSRYGDLELVQGLTLGPSPWTEDVYHPFLKVNAFYLDPRMSQLVNTGLDDYSPAHSSEIPAFFREGILRLDLALVMVSPPDQWGFCSFGPSVGWHPAACESAPVVVAQINPRVPRTGGHSSLHLREIDYAIEAETELPELSPARETPEFKRIGEYVGALINDGDTLQMGVGPLAKGLAPALARHRRLGLHSELVGDEVRQLFDSGVIDNSMKSFLPGKCVAAQAMGSRELYSFLHDNPHFDFRPSEFVNDPMTIAKNDRLVSVNSALMVDITGQVVADSIRGLFRSGVGSMVDFVRGASMSRDGKPVIALPATTTDENGERISSIVAELPAGAGVGCHRSDVHYIATEFGVATLRGRTIQERVQELIQIAHPDFQDDLLEEARKHHLVPEYFNITPLMDKNRASGSLLKKLSLKDQRPYILRILTPADDRRLQEFFYSHTEETILRRYGFTVTRMSRERASELVGVNQNRDLALGIFELHGPRQVIRAVGRYYLDPDGKGAEMAFVVAESRRRLGMARILLDQMITSARERGLHRLWAQVDRDNQPMLNLFRRSGFKEQPGEDYNTIETSLELNPDPTEANSPSTPDFLEFGNQK